MLAQGAASEASKPWVARRKKSKPRRGGRSLLSTLRGLGLFPATFPGLRSRCSLHPGLTSVAAPRLKNTLTLVPNWTFQLETTVAVAAR